MTHYTGMLTEDEYLEHFGKKGMRWGVRNADGTKAAKIPLTEEQRKARNKKIVIASTAAALVVGTIATAVILKKYGKFPISSFAKTAEKTAKVKEAVDKVAEMPSGVLHASRGKDKGFRFINNGGLLGSPLEAYDKSPLGGDQGGENFRKFGKDLSMVSARFLDPEGRTDRAGRVIPHDVVFPNNLVAGINSLDDVRSKVWPLIKDGYDEFYKTTL